MTTTHILRVSITYRDKKAEVIDSTDWPTIGSDWVTLYQGLKRIVIPSQTIHRIEYDVAHPKH